MTKLNAVTNQRARTPQLHKRLANQSKEAPLAETFLPPYLTESEVDELCKPVTQRAAQRRKLCQMLGIRDPSSVPRRPDGLPIIGRKLAEEQLNTVGANKAAAGFNWSR